MEFTIPSIRVGEPMRHNGLSVFPIFTEPNTSLDYVLSDEAMKLGTVFVKEVSEAGTVPYLLVENKGDQRVLFLEGEELVGAKQNRILNTTVLVAAHCTIKIPVSCVEQGRWGHISPVFKSGGTHSPSKLRHVLKSSVHSSLRENRGHASDQHSIWEEVARKQAATGSFSPTSSLHDTFAANQTSLDGFYERIRYVEGTTGVAVALGGWLAGYDLFDKPTTCQKVWNRFLSGFVLDILERVPKTGTLETAEVEKLLETFRGIAWRPTQAVGEGEEYRASSPSGDIASALCFDGMLIHGSLVRAC